jgi:hypothetical protein
LDAITARLLSMRDVPTNRIRSFHILLTCGKIQSWLNENAKCNYCILLMSIRTVCILLRAAVLLSLTRTQNAREWIVSISQFLMRSTVYRVTIECKGGFLNNKQEVKIAHHIYMEVVFVS